MKTKEREAGELYNRGREAVRNGGHEMSMLAGHIEMMVLGTTDFPGPLWQCRELPPDGKVVELEVFEDYLLKPARDGLGLKSLAQLDGVLKATDGGERAIELVRQEIRDYDARVRGDKAKLTESKRAQASTNSRSPAVSDAKRLKRDRPELWSEVESGKKSLNKAAIEAGFRRRLVQVEPTV